MKRFPFLAILSSLVLAVQARELRGGDKAGSELLVEFTDCVESIGVGLVSTQRARPLVPSQFQLAGDATVTPLVVRTSRCGGISTDGHKPKPGAIVQIGLVIVPPDFTGDINNYTLWYFTSDGKLASELNKRGVDARHVPTIDYDLDLDSGSLRVAVAQPGQPRLTLGGTVEESTNPAGSFEANWWKAVDGTTKMDTKVPLIFIGSAHLTLQTDPNEALGRLLGSGSAGFPLLEQFNTFPSAHMTVTSSQ
jgi:hypothetical protein